MNQQTDPDLFGGPTVEDVTLQDQIASVRREIDMRVAVYPRRVERGDMRQADADREILCMRAVLATLHRLEEESVSAMVV